MGDHGESLGDHGESAHGFFIYNSVTHVPLVIRAPFSLTANRRVSDPVRSVDVMPTVLDLLGVPQPGAISGVSLVSLMTGARRELGLDAYSEAMYPLHHYGWSDLRALRSGRYKVIDSPRPELYDLDRDPQRSHEPLRRASGARRSDDRPAADDGGEVCEDDGGAASRRCRPGSARTARGAGLCRLVRGERVGSSNQPRGPQGQNLAVQQAGHGDGDVEGPRPWRRGFISRASSLSSMRWCAKIPPVIDAWFMLGTQYLQHGEPRRAVDYYKRTLSLKPDYDLAVINLAQAYRRLGDDDAALAGFEQYLAIDPEGAFVRYQIGEIWLDRGDLPRAEEQFRQGAGDRPARRVREECAGRDRACNEGIPQAPSG